VDSKRMTIGADQLDPLGEVEPPGEDHGVAITT
jgi:hypothetical protein